MNIGDMVVMNKDSGCWKKDDKAVIIECRKDGTHFADFTMNNKYYQDGKWWVVDEDCAGDCNISQRIEL